MTELPQRKVGIVACSGEEMAEGAVTRLAALRVLGFLRPDDTVTICLPLFLAGGEGDRQFARLHPTIAIDGCGRRCAARATGMYSGRPAAGVVVSDLAGALDLGRVEGRRQLNDAGQRAVRATADAVARLVDDLLGRASSPAMSAGSAPAAESASPAEGEATCSCGSGIPVQNILVDGHMVSFLALPLILRQARDAGRPPDGATARDLLNLVRIYTPVPDGADDAYAAAILRVYADLCAEQKAAA